MLEMNNAREKGILENLSPFSISRNKQNAESIVILRQSKIMGGQLDCFG